MKYNKLVRDKIPEIIKQSNKSSKTHIASSEEFHQKLKEKLLEETNEFINSGNKEELADILEVIYALGNNLDISKEDLENLRDLKAQNRGSFNNKIILEETSD